ncbi:MAG: hypothetical protein ACREJ3_05375, partial [Polyangiaceae bacterium]
VEWLTRVQMTLGLFFGCLEASSVASERSPGRETGLWPPKRDGRFANMSSAKLHAGAESA